LLRCAFHETRARLKAPGTQRCDLDKRSDEAIFGYLVCPSRDCFAALAMTMWFKVRVQFRPKQGTFNDIDLKISSTQNFHRGARSDEATKQSHAAGQTPGTR
jgi:hypothetical protein